MNVSVNAHLNSDARFRVGDVAGYPGEPRIVFGPADGGYPDVTIYFPDRESPEFAGKCAACVTVVDIEC